MVDWAAYVALTHLGLPVAPANLCARILGASLGFVLNGTYTFRAAEGARLGWRRFLRFAASWLTMTLLSTLAMLWFDAHHGLAYSWIAKPLVDAVLAILGFLVSRYWIYR